MRCSYAVMILLGAAGCTKGICSRNSECATGFVCSAYGTCTIAPDANTAMAVDASDQPGATDAATNLRDAMAEPVLDGDL